VVSSEMSYIAKRKLHIKEQIKKPVIAEAKVLLNVLRSFEKLRAFQIAF
jgi:hypothetical protein